MPDDSGTTSNYKIYTYSNQDDDDIRTKGDIIDKINDVQYDYIDIQIPGTVVGDIPPLSSDLSITPYIEHTFIRNAFVGPFKFHL